MTTTTSGCLVHWHILGPRELDESLRFCENIGPYVSGLCSHHREFQHDGCGCDLSKQPPPVLDAPVTLRRGEAKDDRFGPSALGGPEADPNYLSENEAARDAWISERRAYGLATEG